MADGFRGAYKNIGIPIAGIPQTTGQVFFVDSNSGSDSNSGKDPNHALATADAAVNKCSATDADGNTKYGDTIYCMPGHTETTGKTTLDVAGVQIIGLGEHRNRPSFTTATADDVFTVTAANCSIQNVQFGAPGIDAVTAYVNIAADGFVGRNWYAADCSAAASVNVVECITITADGDNCLLENITLFNKTTAVVAFMEIEGACSNLQLRNWWIYGDVTGSGITDSAKVDYLLMDNVNVAVVGTTKPAITLDSNPEGLARNCFFAGTSATIATTANMGNLMRLENIRVTNETDGSLSGGLYPAVDAAT